MAFYANRHKQKKINTKVTATIRQTTKRRKKKSYKGKAAKFKAG